ncbi:NAD(P)H-dependent glycerol-3-phosphate dehydrogenase [Ectothiorhodospira mobilis]|uniref:NAD(P)H-dependent glycerol-3-phosphate dehydrogenase n=1 Tax=Ectothiorhodospira mobilis TaxID=195064 RepID=UPI001EE95C52|nr:NAD(P)H-dependent glycerol-3-phosphate dehydrogenase [Ectothiorhodospira mobilis]MCG5536498.1 NAD(P)-dependent glycerol-3-phosphate dehydrogenase [Ectothiorhodospira mobilis]
MAASPMHDVAVVGAGSWGTALAIHLARKGLDVGLWGRDAAQVAAMAAEGRNARYLPDCPFPPGLHPEADLEALVGRARRVLLAVPSGGFRETLARIAPGLGPGGLVWATKGLDEASTRWLHQLAQEILPATVPWGVASGPSFAGEVARGLPTALTLASPDADFAEAARDWLAGGTLRVYTSDDVVGVQLGGAFKNVLAIAAGVSDGLGFGANARAALITRGLAELMRLGEAAGARSETLMGLSGVGDLVLTCTDDQSRNRRLGLALGRGQSREAAMAAIGQAVEGARTARMAVAKADELGVDMPICQRVYRILYEDLPPTRAVEELLSRDPKPEF